MIAFGGMCLFDIEKWSLLRATLAHCAIIVVTYIIIAPLLHWIHFKIMPILIMTSMIIFVYALIWLIMYIIWKIEIRQMNRLAEEYKKDNEIGED
jgi:RsiW-degrading membrane proteinase PrsW (M82 family)